MREQAIKPKYSEVVQCDVNFFKSFRHNFVNKIKRVWVARNVPHHQVCDQNVVLSVAVVRLLLDIACCCKLFLGVQLVCLSLLVGSVQVDTYAFNFFLHVLCFFHHVQI